MPIMVPHSAAVRVVRKGKRIKILTGQAFDFSEDEIRSVNNSIPGALRKPVNEVVAKPVVDEDDADEAAPKAKAAAEKPAAEKPAKAKKAKAAKPAKAEGEEDADEDEDEDI